MARKSAPQPPGSPTLSAHDAYETLNQQLVSGEQLAASDVKEDAYSQWATITQHWVEESFGARSDKANQFEMAGEIGMVTSAMGPAEFARMRRDALNSKLTQLRAFTTVLKQTAALHAASHAAPRAASKAGSKRVFVVHGHDDGTKATVARFLERLDLEPVILHEQPNGGLTIIEKFEAYADVAFAVVLLTPDDRGGTKAAPYDQQQPRARQNVVLELGYFLGRLGRDKVCALHMAGTEIPSDFHGVLFVQLDPGGAWQMSLARELKHVIPGVDLNKAI
jgi:predicted nucleotide-binding protein